MTDFYSIITHIPLDLVTGKLCSDVIYMLHFWASYHYELAQIREKIESKSLP